MKPPAIPSDVVAIGPTFENHRFILYCYPNEKYPFVVARAVADNDIVAVRHYRLLSMALDGWLDYIERQRLATSQNSVD